MARALCLQLRHPHAVLRRLLARRRLRRLLGRLPLGLHPRQLAAHLLALLGQQLLSTLLGLGARGVNGLLLRRRSSHLPGVARQLVAQRRELPPLLLRIELCCRQRLPQLDDLLHGANLDLAHALLELLLVGRLGIVRANRAASVQMALLRHVPGCAEPVK